MTLRPSDFQLIPVDLLDSVVSYGEWLKGRGYRLDIEPYDLEYPNTPVFRGVLGGAAHYFEVSSVVNIARAEDWAKYGRANSQDTRYIVAILDAKPIPTQSLASLKRMGIGVDVIGINDITSLCNPHDLSLKAEFPSLPKSLNRSLGKAHDLFKQGNWKESYEDACQALENEARTYLRRAIRNRRVLFVTERGKSVSYSLSRIDGMTLGQLAVAFSELTGPTQIESRVAQALARINPRRKKVAHFKYKSGTKERDLRAQVGKDLIVIVNTMKMLASK